MRHIPVQIRLFLRQVATLWLIYIILRLFFIFMHFKGLQGVSAADWLAAWLVGLRFDLSAILMTLLPLFFLSFAPYKIWSRSWYQKLLLYGLIAINVIFIGASSADLEFYKFTGKRMTIDLFFTTQDVENQVGQLFLYYWPLVTLALILLGMLYYLNRKPLNYFKTSVVATAACYFLTTVFVVIGIRGGLQLKPLKAAQAYQFQNTELGSLALNSSFSLLKSKSTTKLHVYQFMPSEEAVQRLKKVPENKIKIARPNVVIIILESFALEYFGKVNKREGFTPFLDSLSEKSVFIRNAFANGRRSIEAVPSILAGIPSWMNEPFITSDYQSIPIIGIGEIMKKHGYSTHFFHAAENGSMFFDSFTKRAGFDHYYGLNEYPEAKRDTDGVWGIFDEPYLQYVNQLLSKEPEPFLAAIFTLTSHQPYPVPAEYKSILPKGTLEIHQSIAYTDLSLKKFFAAAEKQPWFKNTIFVITADHTQKSEDPAYANIQGHYRVPLMFYDPQNRLPQVDPERVAQHIDVMPSILHLLGLEGETHAPYGRSVFDLKNPGRALNIKSGGFWFLSGANYFEIAEDGQLNKDEHSEQSLDFKALLQVYTESLTAHPKAP